MNFSGIWKIFTNLNAQRTILIVYRISLIKNLL